MNSVKLKKNANKMNHKLSDRPHHADFFIQFPIGKLAGWLFLLLLGVMVVYRLSEAAGQPIENACLAAIALRTS